MKKTRPYSKTFELPKILAIISFATTIFYLIFILFYNPVHFFYKPTDENLITPWLRSHLAPLEGVEAYFMFFAMFVYLGAVWIMLKKFRSLKLPKFVWYLSLLPLGLILVRTRSEIFTFSNEFGLNLKIVGSIMAFLIICFFIFKLNSLTKSIFFYLLWVAFGLLVFLSMDQAAEFSYSFIIGPALKIIQGENLNSFQIYYGLPLTLLFVLLVKLKLLLNQMQLVFGIIFVVWFVLYYFLAAKLIKDKFLLFLFMSALLMFRFFAIRHDPTAIVEVSPIRLELWVPLMILILRFGILSPVSATAFSLAYFLDNFFGAMYLAVYTTVAAFIFWQEKPKALSRMLIPIAIPILLSLLMRLYLFGSLFSETARIYQSIRLYFQPISNRSVFWILVPIYGLFLSLVISLEKNKIIKRNLQLLLGLAVVQLMYFFGPSLDHNLLNISGIYILLFFICLDYIIRYFISKKLVYILASVLIIFGGVSFSKFFNHKIEQANYRLVSGNFTPTHELDQKIENSPNLFGQNPEKVFIMSDLDSYYNYRYNLPQIGYYTPYHTNIFLEDTTKTLVDLKNRGYKLVLWESQMLESLSFLNQSNFLKDKNLKFHAKDNGDYLELSLEKNASSSGNLVTAQNWSTFNSRNDNFSFIYPPGWKIEESTNGVVVSDRLHQFMIYIESFSTDDKLPDESFGVLINEGLAKIPNTDRAYVKMFSDNGTQKLLLYLHKAEKVVKVLVFPANSDKMIQFGEIISSIN